MNEFKYEEGLQPDPRLRTTVCPVDVTIMPTEQALAKFFLHVEQAKTKKQVFEAFKDYAIARGCFSNIQGYPKTLESLRKHGMIDEQGRLG